MADLSLPVVNAIDNLRESNKDQRERLQKSMRAGLLNVVRSVDRMHATLTRLQSPQSPAEREVEPTPSGGEIREGSNSFDRLMGLAQTLFQFKTSKATGKEEQLTQVMLKSQGQMADMFGVMSGIFAQMNKKLSDIAAIEQRLLQFKLSEVQKKYGLDVSYPLDGLIEESVRTVQKTYERQRATTEGYSDRLLRGAKEIAEEMGSSRASSLLAEGLSGNSATRNSPIDPIADTTSNFAENVRKIEQTFGTDFLKTIGENTKSQDNNTKAVENDTRKRNNDIREQSLWFGKNGLFGESNRKLADSMKKLKETFDEYGSGEGIMGGMLGGLGGLLFGAAGGKAGMFAGRSAAKAVKLTWRMIASIVPFFMGNPLLAGGILLAGLAILGMHGSDLLSSAPTPDERPGLVDQSTEQNRQLEAIENILKSEKLTADERAEFEAKKAALEQSLAGISKDLTASYNVEQKMRNIGKIYDPNAKDYVLDPKLVQFDKNEDGEIDPAERRAVQLAEIEAASKERELELMLQNFLNKKPDDKAPITLRIPSSLSPVKTADGEMVNQKSKTAANGGAGTNVVGNNNNNNNNNFTKNNSDNVSTQTFAPPSTRKEGNATVSDPNGNYRP